MKAASKSPTSSSARPTAHHPPHKPHYPNNLLDPDALKHFERALAQQYAREYLSKSPTSSSVRPTPHNPPHKLHYPNNLLDPDALKHFERALAQQYAREYLSKHNPNKSPNQVFKPRMDLCEDPDSQTITACLELPGIKPTDVEIQLHDDKLMVSGKRSAPPPSSSGARYPIQELKYGAFQRSIDLPTGIQQNQMTASMSDGILILQWPKDPQRLPPIRFMVDEGSRSKMS
jgi:HSP20 family protein